MITIESAGALIANDSQEVLLTRQAADGSMVCDIPHSVTRGESGEPGAVVQELFRTKYNLAITPLETIDEHTRKVLGFVTTSRLVVCRLDVPAAALDSNQLAFRSLERHSVSTEDIALGPLAQRVRWLVQNEGLRL